MNKTGVLMIVILTTLGFSSKNSSATEYDVNICFWYEAAFSDTGTIQDPGVGDHFRNNNYKIARGAKVKVTRVFGNWDVFFDYVDVESGCTPPLTLNSIWNYRITIYSEAKLQNSNIVKLRNYWEAPSLYARVLSSTFKPNANGFYFFTWDDYDADWVPTIAAGTGFSLYRNHGDTYFETFYVYNYGCDGDISAFTGEYICLGTAGRRRRFSMAHEMGHNFIYLQAGVGRAYGYDYASNECEGPVDSHSFDSQEFQRAAAWEGIAQFYSASVWNNEEETNCDFDYYRAVDMDHDGDLDGENPDPWNPLYIYSCDYGVQFMDSHCDADDQENPPTLGNEFDWLRFWWDLHAREDVSITTISHIWEEANPDDEDGWTDGTAYLRLRSAAISNGISANTWDYWAAQNGVDHYLED